MGWLRSNQPRRSMRIPSLVLPGGWQRHARDQCYAVVLLRWDPVTSNGGTMLWIVVNIHRIMIVSGVLTLTMIYAAIAPEAALRSTFGESLSGPVANIVGEH